MVKQIFNKRTKRGMAVLMAAAMVGTMAPVSMPAQPTWTVQAATAVKEVSKNPTVVTATAIDYAEETLTLGWTDEDKTTDIVYYAIVTNKKFDESKLNTYPKASAYEVVEKNQMDEIDLSWVNFTKADTYLFVTTDPDATIVKPAWIKLATQNTKLKISYAGTLEEPEKAITAGSAIGDAENGYLVIDNGTGKNPDKVTFDKMQYRTENGKAWADVKSNLTSLKRYTSKGATLQMRVKATETNPAGKTFKVKVSAKAKAPKVTVNYLNQTVKFAGGMEVATGSATDSTEDIKNWTPITKDDAKTAKALSSVLGYNGDYMKIFVRTAANGKKAASKVNIVRIGYSQVAPEAVVATNGAMTPSTEKGKVSIDYKVSYNVASGIQMTNNTDTPMQFAIVEKSKVIDKDNNNYVDQDTVDALGIANSKEIKWTSVAAAKTDSKGNFKPGAGTITKVGTTKISDLKAEDYVILYRTADKKATIISRISVVAFPVKLAQDITVNKDAIDVKEVTVTTNAATKVDMKIALTNRVNTKKIAKITAGIFTAKEQDGKYVADAKTSDIAAKVTMGTDGTATLAIKGTAKADVAKKYIVQLKCEGAVLNLLVGVGTEVGVSGTASAPEGGSTVVSKFGEAQIFNIASGLSFAKAPTIETNGCATVVAEKGATTYSITPSQAGNFSFEYMDSDINSHTVTVTIDENGVVTVDDQITG